jgi:predicted AAA+ superfamily ATPase
MADSLVQEALKFSGAVVIEGPKWCGKTWTGMTYANSAVWVADPAGNYLNRRTAQADPFALLNGQRPVLIDEWQDAPGLWDAVRMEVDRKPGPGQFLLTGSATPRDGVVSHSGTGRMTRIRMSPMTLAESGMSSGKVSLRRLLDGESLPTVQSRWSEDDLIDAVLRGGWPGTLELPQTAAASQAASYLESVAYSDASQIDGVRRDPARMTALLASLSRNTATLVSNTTLVRDMEAFGDSSASTKTVSAYLDVLRRLFVLVEIPAWSPSLRSPIRLRHSPKRLLCDPSLAAAGLHASAETLAADRKTLGFLFETLCLRDLQVYAQLLSADVYHYHDESELEADAIVQTKDGRWMGVEIKLGYDKEDAAAGSLLSLNAKMVAAGEQPAAALLVVTGPTSFAHRRDDGVAVVPADVLTA